MQAPSRSQGTVVRPFESLAVPVLRADVVWELMLGAGLVLTAVESVMRPLGSAALQPRFIPVIVGVACLALGGFLIYASKQPPAEAAAVCRPLAGANLGAAAVAVALVITFPGAGHLYVAALAIASTVCAMFAAAEWAVSQPARRHSRDPS
jgi:hypothetical protein